MLDLTNKICYNDPVFKQPQRDIKMATTVNVNDKRHAVASFVADALQKRVSDLHTTVIDHWNEVVAEVFDETFAKQCNDMVTSIIDVDKPTRSIALSVGGTWNHDVIRDSVTVEEVGGVKDLGFFHPKFGSCFDPTNINHYLFPNLTEMWNNLTDETGFVYQLPVPFKRLIANPENDSDESSVCEIDENEYTNFMSVDMDNFIPTDCTTQKALRETVTDIKNIAEQLATKTFDAIRTCRSVEAIIKVVPQLEPYLCTAASEDATSAINDLMKQARGE